MPFVRKTLMEQLPRTGSGFANNDDYVEFRKLLYDVIEKQQPMTVRQMFYRAVVKNYVEKTEKGYGYIQRDLVYMRKNGEIPYDWIVDESRSMRGGQRYNYNVDEFMEGLIDRIPNMYGRSLLADHDFSIQVWLEKEALLGVVHPITMKWDVPLVPAKGYSSLSLLYDAAQDLEPKERPIKIFHFGDYDPSGQNAIETVQRDLPGLFPKIEQLGIEFHIVAVTPEQIDEMNLPTRPTKTKDPRSKDFGDESVELDAIEPEVLRRMVDDTLRGCFPSGALEKNKKRIKEDRDEIRRRLRKLLK